MPVSLTLKTQDSFIPFTPKAVYTAESNSATSWVCTVAGTLMDSSPALRAAA